MQKCLEIWSARRFPVTVKGSSSKPTAPNTCGKYTCTVLSVSVKQIHNPPLPVCWWQRVAVPQRGRWCIVTSGCPRVEIRRGEGHIQINCLQKLLEGFGISEPDLGPLMLTVLSVEEGNLCVLPELEEGWCLQPPLNCKKDREGTSASAGVRDVFPFYL